MKSALTFCWLERNSYAVTRDRLLDNGPLYGNLNYSHSSNATFPSQYSMIRGVLAELSSSPWGRIRLAGENQREAQE